MTLTHGSLFSGIGGIDLGFERAGFRSAFQVEYDPHALRVLEKNFPNTARFTDVKRFGRAQWPGAVDVLSGGFPCQDISVAGKGAGLAGSRSGLWYEYLRVIRELGPRYIVVENVAALYFRGLGDVLGDLAACGYDAEWDCLPAAAFGAPHLRERVFIVAYPGRLRRDAGRPEQPLQGAGVPGEAPLADSHYDKYRTAVEGITSEAEGVEGVARQAHDPSREPSGAGSLRRTGKGYMADSYSDRTERNQSEDGPGAASDAYDQRRLVFGLRPRGRPEEYRVGRTGKLTVSGCGDRGDGWWSVEPRVGRVAYGVPDRVDRLKRLGNAVVPQVAEFIARRIRADIERNGEWEHDLT